MTAAARGAAPLVECVGVGRTYGRGSAAVTAVRDVCCTIPVAARVAVTGPSGSGKSTLVHLLAGLDIPTAGCIQWPTQPDPTRVDPDGIGVVFQGPSLVSSLDVTENVTLPMLLHGLSEAAARARADAVLGQLGLDVLAAALPDELSGGQAQRVAIARVLASRPFLILADEPTGQLDHHTAGQVLAVLLETADSLGAAVLVTTHDPVVAARFDRRWTMTDGRLHTDASPVSSHTCGGG